jgi:hypothetical protein
MVFFVQCTDEPDMPDAENPVLKAGKGNGNGGGNGGGGSGGGNGGTGGLYGDLIICLRSSDGIPIYEPITGEHGLAYYPRPIMIDESTLEPLFANGSYQTFELNEEGEPIPEEGYIVMEVEFGRLNIVRAPQAVIDQALTEAIGNLNQPGLSEIKTDASGRLIAIIGEEDWLVNYDDDPLNDEDNDKTIDSPRENVAIYQELLSNRLTGQLDFLELFHGYTDSDVMELAYGAIAAGADKTGTMNVDEFAYMNNWLLKWESTEILELSNSPDEKDRHYYDYSGFNYSRAARYATKYVKITVLNPDGTWSDTYESLLNVVPWTSPTKLIDYENGNNINITGFSNAADDAIQVLEFIHSSDLIEYSPYFTATGFNPPL